MSENTNLIEQEIMSRAEENELSCTTAFEIAGKLQIRPKEVGEAADRLDIRLAKCQLGLFGYKPDKKTVKALETVPEELKAAIHKSLAGGKLTCVKSWEIADALGMPKFSVSCSCETLGIKIKDCQLGAF
jgi:hypothetical protein